MANMNINEIECVFAYYAEMTCQACNVKIKHTDQSQLNPTTPLPPPPFLKITSILPTSQVTSGILQLLQ